jgi:phage tail sheath protein FI
VKLRRGLEPVAPEEQKPQDMAQWLSHFNRRSMFGALYYPWIKVANPRNNNRPLMVPPCGHMMGIWCRTDESRGVYKAPANETPRGVLGLAYETNMREQELLNPLGIIAFGTLPTSIAGIKFGELVPWSNPITCNGGTSVCVA